MRRTRIDGDDWDLPEVPLGEEAEQYQLRVMQNDTVLRDAFVSQPEWIYSAAMQAADGVGSVFRLEVAQVSARYGAGLYSGLDVGE